MDPRRQIEEVMAEWTAALCARDVERLLACYTDDAVSFDAIPPFTDNVASLREKYLACFPCMPEGARCETRHLQLQVNGDLAFAHYHWRLAGPVPDDPIVRTWLRSTAVWRRQAGAWRICHEHWSLPFDPESGKVVFLVED